jgi:hypothetical protein
MIPYAALTGGCFCGRIRYAARGTPFHETLCHCTDCRRAAGAPAVAWFSVRRQEFQFTAGDPRAFRSSDRAIRRFCPDCGTQLTFEADALPDEIDITTASLDDPDAVPPRDHCHVEGRVAWDIIADGRPLRQPT